MININKEHSTVNGSSNVVIYTTLLVYFISRSIVMTLYAIVIFNKKGDVVLMKESYQLQSFHILAERWWYVIE